MGKIKIIFVCLGNICRSPAAQGVMEKLIKEEKLEDFVEVDSAGTIAYHHGESADSRMIKHASRRSYELTSIARKFNPQKDFDDADYIVTMDNENYKDVLEMDYTGKYRNKIYKMTQFSRKIKAPEVPDPYYKGAEGFEYVLDILEDACGGLLERIKDEVNSEPEGKD